MKTPTLSLFIASMALLTPISQAAPEAIEIHSGNVDVLPGGREADGIIGDFVLRNEHISAVISHNAPERRANMSTFYGADGVTPGCLYDLSVRGEVNDQITVFTPGRQRGEVSWVRILSDGSEGAAAVETVTTAAKGDGIGVRHVYTLEEGARTLKISTTWENEKDAEAEIAIGDIWTRFEKSGITGRWHWAESVDPADRCGYAFTWVSPDSADYRSGKTMLGAGESFTIERLIAVAESPAHALSLLMQETGETETYTFQVRDPAGAPVSDAQVRLRLGSSDVPAYTNEEGIAQLDLVPAEYDLRVQAPGRDSLSVKAGDSGTPIDIELSGRSAITFSITDSEGKDMPCKVQFHGINGTKNPNLGPTIRAHGCADQWHSETGSFEAAVPAGSYRVIITRGPEYSHLEQEVTVGADETVQIEGQLTRLVDTSGWVSADFHNHSTPSGDNVCGTADRVINLAAEHIEYAPTTEHNRIYDWAPYIEKLGLTEFISTVPGMELTGRGAHLNTFPLEPVWNTQDNGAPVWDLDPRVNTHHLRNLGGWDPDRWVQINHPDLTQNFLDRNGDQKIDGGFMLLSKAINGVETQNYRTSNILAAQPFFVSDPLARGSRITQVREFIWLQLLNQGHRIWATAVADAHTVYGNGVGSWRVYLPSSSDNPAEISLEEVLYNASNGHMILSSGPFLEVETGSGEGAGESLSASDGEVKLNVKVQCNDWIDIDRVQVLVNGHQDPELNFTRESHPKMFSDQTMRFDQSIEVALEEDAHLIVVTMGENHSLEKGFGTSPQSPIKPCAYNNPIFVDVDGDGFQPCMDTLGYELPVNGLSVDQVRRILENR